MKRYFILILLTLVSLLFLNGCWNSKELSDLAIVIGIGIDKVPNSDQYKVSLLIVNPSTVAAGKGSGGKSTMPNIVFSSVDRTLLSAFRKSSQKVSRRLFFAHSQLLVIGEPVAREGIYNLFDYFERSHELRLTSSVVIARGIHAESLLNILTPLQSITATSIKDKLKVSSESWAQSVDVNVIEVIKRLSGSGEPVISGMRVIGNPSKGNKKSNLEKSPPYTTIETNGIAIFSNGKLSTWLDGKVARGVIWVLNKMKSTIINIDCEDKKEAISIEIIRSSSKLRVDVLNGKPSLSLHVTEEGNFSEAKCPINPNNHDELVKLQNQLTEETKKEIKSAIKATQKKKSDIFGFSTELERTHPREWKKMKNNWPNLYSETEVKVSVEAYIRRTGLRINSYMKSEEE
ncbi:Ger(x)C family spore germination protein [Paenibacillus sp. PL91]|uniref:Ger(x)C family spore germination protein n=1 Tax=Paenibacillus sp. PL91 TaxID=2729538 RepID=UPI00145F1E72|nr:Ger(x)C family spore germination protein [Paenibacillus sp. PL91]MBC9200043.1 Ger(x)C family spore germination protein [Paenibacillus sp. PL91]